MQSQLKSQEYIFLGMREGFETDKLILEFIETTKGQE